MTMCVISNNLLFNYGQILSCEVFVVCVSNKNFSMMFIYKLSSRFTKTKKRCYEKNDIFQSYHFTEITTKQKKMSKTSCKLFTIFNHDSCDSHNVNHNITIVCCDFFLNIVSFV